MDKSTEFIYIHPRMKNSRDISSQRSSKKTTKNVSHEPPNRWPVIIASIILCLIVIAGMKKWSRKELNRESIAAAVANEDSFANRPDDIIAAPSAQSISKAGSESSGPTASSTRESSRLAKRSRSGISDAERASLPLDQFLLAEGLDVDRIQADPASIERRMQIRADSLSDGQRLDLRERVLAQDTPINEKEVAVHLLILNVPASVTVLKSIAVAPVAESKNPEALSPELPLRLTALQGLETASLRDPRLRRALLEVAERAPNKTVREVAQLSAQQAAKGRSFFEDYTKVLAGEKRK